MYVGVYLGVCHLIELNNFSIINFLMLNIQSCRGSKNQQITFLLFSLLFHCGEAGTQSFNITPICIACSVKFMHTY